MDTGYAKKGLIPFFPSCSRRHVAWVKRYVRYRHQLAAFRYQTEQTFLPINANLTYGCLVKTFCRHQDVPVSSRIGQIHGAGVN